MTMDPENAAEFTGETVEGRMIDLDLTQAELATAAGVSTKTIQKLLRCRLATYQPKKLAALSRSLQWPADLIQRMLAGETVVDELVKADRGPRLGPTGVRPRPESGSAVGDALREIDELIERLTETVRALSWPNRLEVERHAYLLLLDEAEARHDFVTEGYRPDEEARLAAEAQAAIESAREDLALAAAGEIELDAPTRAALEQVVRDALPDEEPDPPGE